MNRVPYPSYISRTGSKFETNEKFLTRTSLVKSDEKHLEYSGLVLTEVYDNITSNKKEHDPVEEEINRNKATRVVTMATTKEEMHTFILGETGSGKTRRVILPTIRLMAKSGRSMIISDPKGELYKKTASSLKYNGYDVIVMNFRNPSRGTRWNPFEYIERLYRSNDLDSQDLAVVMLSDMAKILTNSIQSQKDKFWENEAVKLFVGFALMILDTCPQGSLTIENISILGKECCADLSRPRHGFKEYVLGLEKNSVICSNLYGITAMANETRASVVASFEGLIAPFVNQKSLLDLFAKSEFDIESIGKKPTALFFILPDDTDVMYGIATAFVKQLYSGLINLADSKLNGVLDNRVSFILDEFANFATIPAIESMLTAARSRGITFTLVCQSMEQLEKKYRDGASEVLMSNCRVWIYMSCRNYRFLERLEKLVGQYASPYTGEQYPLISTAEMQHFEMGEVLILNDRCWPVIGHLPDYSQYDFGEPSVDVTMMPEKSEPTERIIIDPGEVVTNARNAVNEARAKQNHEMIQTMMKGHHEMSAAGSSLLERFGKETSIGEEESADEEDTNDKPFDIDALIREIDERIAHLEEESQSSNSSDDADVEDSDDDDDEDPDDDDTIVDSKLAELLKQKIKKNRTELSTNDDEE